MSDHESYRSFGRWLKFNLVGAIGIAVQLAALAVLTRLHIEYMLATALAVEVAVVHNFMWHERFTWADRCHGKRYQTAIRFLRFNLTTGAVSIGGNLVLMHLFVGEANLPPVVANLISIAICSLANFVVSDRWVFSAALNHSLDQSDKQGCPTSGRCCQKWGF